MAAYKAILEQQLLEIGKYIEHKDVEIQEVSKASVGWHIAHILKVFNMVYEQMKNSDPAKYKWEFSMPRIIVFLSKKIPRGKAKAPKAVLPEADFNRRELEQQLHEAKQNLHKYDELLARANFKHPYFKQLNKKQTLKFLSIHNEHHLKIVRDIVKEV